MTFQATRRHLLKFKVKVIQEILIFFTDDEDDDENKLTIVILVAFSLESSAYLDPALAREVRSFHFLGTI